MVEAQRELPPEEAALGRFWGCLAAALLGGAPEIASLEAPFTDMWQEFPDALQAAPGEDRDPGGSSHGCKRTAVHRLELPARADCDCHGHQDAVDAEPRV